MAKGKFKIPRIPGDTIVYPMIIGVILNSVCPSVLQMGSFFTSVVGGTGALVGAFLFFLGASIDIKSSISISFMLFLFILSPILL